MGLGTMISSFISGITGHMAGNREQVADQLGATFSSLGGQELNPSEVPPCGMILATVNVEGEPSRSFAFADRAAAHNAHTHFAFNSGKASHMVLG